MKETKLSQWGEDQAIRIPPAIIEQLGFTQDTPLTLTVCHDQLIIQKSSDGPVRLAELFREWQDDGVTGQELCWGDCHGDEIQW